MVRHTENNPAEERMANKPKMVNCNECNEVFSKRIELIQHKREEHNMRWKSVCPVCKKSFETEKRLRMHSLFHNVGGEYECFYCHKQFNKAWKMKIHLVNHSGRPPYICQYCGDDFLYPGKIVSHLKRIHDVWFACKHCGEACPVNRPFDSHKCKIYGCKDCLMSFASRSELALHVEKHNNDAKHLVTEEPVVSSTPPLVDESNVEGMENMQGVRNEKVVRFVNFGKLQRPTKVAQNGTCDTTELPESNASELNTESDVAQDPVTDQNMPDSPLLKCEGNNGNVGETRNVTVINEFKSQSRESPFPVATFVINSGEVDLSSFSSVLSKSPSDSSWGAFKVPEASITTWKRYENPIKKSLRKKQEEIEKAAKKKEELKTRLQLSVDTDAKLTQRNQISFESWLTSDSYSSTNHDFVFGFEASVTVSDHPKESQYHYFNKKIPQKEKGDMTFEDLCQF